jgi:uracil-DNA glycosylase
MESEDKLAEEIKAKIGESWYKYIGAEFGQHYMQVLSKFLAKRRREVAVYPEPRDVFNAFRSTPYDKIKVVILGQDPYHTPGVAHGLAFSSKNPTYVPPSLEVIFREIENDLYKGLHVDMYSEANLSHLADQGVLLLNPIMTVDKGKPLSHAGKGWELFTDQVIRALNRHSRRLVWMLWGNKAKLYNERRLIDSNWHLVLEAAHPAAESYRSDGSAGFFGCKHFSQANEFLDKCGYGKINWTKNVK